VPPGPAITWAELTAGADTIEHGKLRPGAHIPEPGAPAADSPMRRMIDLSESVQRAYGQPAGVACTGTTKAGNPCKRNAEPGSDKCSYHDGSAGRSHGREDRGIAPHPVRVSQAGWTYCCASCSACERSGLDRGIYLDARPLGPLPHVHAQISTHEGAGSEMSFLLSSDPDAPRSVIAPQDVDSGRWADRLGMYRSADRRVIDALASTIRDLATRAPARRAALHSEDRTETGHIPVPEEGCLPEGYLAQPRALSEAERRRARLVLASIARRRPKIALTYGASLSAPFAGPLGEQSHWWQLFGRPRQGKTITLMVAASPWGSPRTPPDGELIRSWDATARWLARRLGKLGTIPAFVDESGTASFGPADWGRVLYGSVQGASRGQAETYGTGERSTPGWAGVLFTTGNGRVTAGLGAGASAGILARVIELEGPFTGAPRDQLQSEPDRLKRAVLADYGWAGPQVLQAVTVEDMRAMMRQALAALDAPVSGTAGTIARSLALAVAGAMAADRVFDTPGAFTTAAMAAARDYLAVHSAEPESDRERLLAELAGSMASRRGAWPGADAAERPDAKLDRELLGVTDGEFVYVLGKAWRDLVSASGVDEAVALAELYDAGQLYVTEARRRAGGWTMEGPRQIGKPRCHTIRRSALTGPDQDGGGSPGDWPADSAGADANRQVQPELADAAGAPVPPPAAGAPACTVCGGAMNAVLAELGEVSHPTCDESGPAARSGEREHQGDAPAAAIAPPAPAAPGNDTRAAQPTEAARDAFLAAASLRHQGCKHTPWRQDQEEALERRLELLDDPEIGEHPERLRLLEALEGSHDKSGPFAPTRRAIGKGGKPYQRGPYWQAPQPEVVESAYVVAGWAWSREYDGPVIVLDRNAGYPSASASVEIPHGQLEHTGPVDLVPGSIRPGHYLMTVYPWLETGMPSPLGSAKVGTQVWVPAPTAALLADLARQGRWPDAAAADSWTGEPSRLASWAHLVAELRRYALQTYGPDSGAYGAVKIAEGQARGLMTGHLTGSPQNPRQWDCKARRPDIPQHIAAQHSATLWRTADKALRLTGSELGPVAIRNMDEMVIPAAALPMLTGAEPPVIRIDETRITLGTFKTKDVS
jgi:hypothetical protein